MEENERYAMEGDLVFVSYHPDKLKIGMYFVHPITVGTIEPITELFILEEIPEDQHAFMVQYGAPVKLFIMSTFDAEILVYPDQVGWYDSEEEDVEETVFTPISLEHLNNIINICGGLCWVEIDAEDNPILLEGKAIISYDVPVDDDDLISEKDEHN